MCSGNCKNCSCGGHKAVLLKDVGAGSFFKLNDELYLRTVDTSHSQAVRIKDGEFYVGTPYAEVTVVNA